MEIEHFFMCPHCWQRISMLVDPASGAQTYIEDCEVCCRPIRIVFEIENGALKAFAAERPDE